MVFIATFWAAVVNLVLLVVALAMHPASLDGFHWLRELPWAWFGNELQGALDMQAVDAGALWALWIVISSVLLAGSALAYAMLEMDAKPAPVAQPQVAAMFSDLSNGMEGLKGFGTAAIPALAPAAELPRHQHAAHEIHLADAAPHSPATPLVPAPDKAQAIAATLQQIDPQLSASYDALLRELKK